MAHGIADQLPALGLKFRKGGMKEIDEREMYELCHLALNEFETYYEGFDTRESKIALKSAFKVLGILKQLMATHNQMVKDSQNTDCSPSNHERG